MQLNTNCLEIVAKNSPLHALNIKWAWPHAVAVAMLLYLVTIMISLVACPHALGSK